MRVCAAYGRAGRRSARFVLLALVLWSASVESASNVGVPTSPVASQQQIQQQPQHTVRRDLHDQLEVLASELDGCTQRAALDRGALQHRIDASQARIASLFASERSATEQFVRDTRVKMQTMRDVLEIEMHDALREMQQRIQQAVENVSALAQQRARTKQAHVEQLHELSERRRAAAAERQRRAAQDAAAAEARALAAAWSSASSSSEDAEDAASALNVSTVDQVDRPSATTTDQLPDAPRSRVAALVQDFVATLAWLFVRVVVPAVLAIGGVLLALVAVVKLQQRQRAKQRARRVLYSNYLKPRDGRTAGTASRHRDPLPSAESVRPDARVARRSAPVARSS